MAPGLAWAPASPALPAYRSPPSPIASSRATASPDSFSSAAAKVLAQMADRRGAGDQQDVGRAAEQPGERDLHRRRPERAARRPTGSTTAAA